MAIHSMLIKCIIQTWSSDSLGNITTIVIGFSIMSNVMTIHDLHSDTCVTGGCGVRWAWVNKPTSPDSLQLAFFGSFGLVKTRHQTR